MRSPKTTAQLIYYKTRTGYTYKLRVQDYATGKNFSSNQCPKQRVLLFSRESYFQNAIENFFPVFAWADMIHSRGWKKSRQSQTLDFVQDLHNCLKFF